MIVRELERREGPCRREGVNTCRMAAHRCSAPDCAAVALTSAQLRPFCAVHRAVRDASGYMEYLASSLRIDDEVAVVDGVRASGVEIAQWIRLTVNHGRGTLRPIELRNPLPAAGEEGQLHLTDLPPGRLSVRGIAGRHLWCEGHQITLAMSDLRDASVLLVGGDCAVQVTDSSDWQLTIQTPQWELQAAAATGGTFEAGKLADGLRVASDHAGLNTLRVDGGNWLGIGLGVDRPRVLELSSLEAPALAVIGGHLDVIHLYDATIGDLELTELDVGYVWIRHCTIADMHGGSVRTVSHWIHDTTIKGRCSIRSSRAQTLALTECRLHGRTAIETDESGATEHVSLAGTSTGAKAPLSVRPGAPCTVWLDSLETLSSFDFGAPDAPATFVGRGLRLGGRTTLFGDRECWLNDVVAGEFTTINLALWDGETELELTDCQFGGGLRLDGPQGDSDRLPALHVWGYMDGSELHFERLDLGLTSFVNVPLHKLRLGPGNVFNRLASGRQEILDAMDTRPLSRGRRTGQDERKWDEIASQYRGLRTNLESWSDSSLANDFYAGEMHARQRDVRTRPSERAVVALYGLLGGWGVRPLKPFVALLTLLVLVVLVGLFVGVTGPAGEHVAAKVDLIVESLVPWGRAVPTAGSFALEPGFRAALVPVRVAVLLLAGFVGLGLRSQVKR